MLFLWTATAFDSVPGTAVSLSGRDWNRCLNHCLPPVERTETVSPSALATNHRPHRVRMPRLQFAPSGLWDFTLTVQAVFGNRSSFWVLWWCTKGRAVSNKVCHTGLWTLSRRHIQPKVWKCPLHIRGPFQRGLSFHLSVVKMYCIQDLCLAAWVVFTEYLRQVYKLDVSVLSLPSAVGEY